MPDVPGDVPGDVLDGVRGRTALVTGAGNGLGRAIALALGDAGVRVVAAGRTRANLDETARLMTARGAGARVAPADVADAGSVAALASAVADEDVSIVVNCAGVAGPVKPLTEIEPDEWDAVFAANVRGTYLVCRALIPALLARGSGDIINIASVSGKRPLALRTPYTASKMAVIGLTTTLGAEVGPLGIRVNSLSPGPVRGPRMERNFRLEAARLGITEQEAETAFASRAALGRLLEEDEVGRAVVAMLMMSGLHCADIDLSAGMVAR
ncbi:SDR family NAD(P)-dependent oxidoreductase [Actinomadura mexicana]|uniref:NADP-dependent 3-hydroxy acid dehydrogenase YdfG n=1 Tax=Actinomadura mexicana TaxID=134959 RepID=A0A238URL7_9ACTN|nr:SDR family NAD(P)-dependent oxidoreductase [Actinomadura mexicana]SNR24083.1 NADP-dependent 3-hydroxy acid dehydrogenase YdfG [Actinomadura mexicana]